MTGVGTLLPFTARSAKGRFAREQSLGKQLNHGMGCGLIVDKWRYRSDMAFRIAVSTEDYAPSRRNRQIGSPGIEGGCAINCGDVPRCRWAACTRKGWHKYTVPALPWASSSRHCAEAAKPSAASSRSVRPASSAGASCLAMSICEPTRMRVLARNYGAAHQGRTDDTIRLPVNIPRFSACIRWGVHRLRSCDEMHSL